MWFIRQGRINQVWFDHRTRCHGLHKNPDRTQPIPAWKPVTVQVRPIRVMRLAKKFGFGGFHVCYLTFRSCAKFIKSQLKLTRLLLYSKHTNIQNNERQENLIMHCYHHPSLDVNLTSANVSTFWSKASQHDQEKVCHRTQWPFGYQGTKIYSARITLHFAVDDP